VQVEIYVPTAVMDGADTIDGLIDSALDRKSTTMKQLLEGAELRGAQTAGQDTLGAAEGDSEDLTELLRYLLGE
jgi:hypothetical protein